jgi:hypothetical protein
MSGNIVLASFAKEENLLVAAQTVRKQNWQIVDVFAPHAVHGLEDVLGWPRSRLPVACFLGGATGVVLATWFQFWTTATDWPLNVGGRPWNSLPAFVPVIFECMVLLAGLGVVFAWLCRCRLYPGKEARIPMAGLTDDRYVMMIRLPSPGPAFDTVQHVLAQCQATSIEERAEEEPQ